jgi:hypothetical protein
LLAPQYLAQRLAVVSDAFARDNFIHSIAAFENVGWHLSDSVSA